MNSNINVKVTFRTPYIHHIAANIHISHACIVCPKRTCDQLIFPLDLMGLMFLHVDCFENQENKISA